MRLIGYPNGSTKPCHGTLREDMTFMAECTLATVEGMADLKRKGLNEFRRQKELAKFAVSSCILHGVQDEPTRQKCPRVREILDAYHKSGALRMPWEEGE